MISFSLNTQSVPKPAVAPMTDRFANADLQIEGIGEAFAACTPIVWGLASA
jgi:hypothetical protein